MRSIIAAVIAVLTASVAFADPSPHRARVSVFGSDVGYVTGNERSSWSGGPGVALAYDWTPRWSMELAVADEQHHLMLTRFVPMVIDGRNGYAPATSFENHRTYPVDLLARYSRVNETRWTPFVGVGFHHVSAPNTHPSGIEIPVIPDGSGNASEPVKESRFSDVNAGEVVAGLAVTLTPRLQFEAGLRRLLTQSRSQDAFDPRTRAIVGLSFRFW